jgi:hypothetical protein
MDNRRVISRNYLPVLAYDDDAASKRKALVKNFMVSCSDDIS